MRFVLNHLIWHGVVVAWHECRAVWTHGMGVACVEWVWREYVGGSNVGIGVGIGVGLAWHGICSKCVYTCYIYIYVYT